MKRSIAPAVMDKLGEEAREALRTAIDRCPDHALALYRLVESAWAAEVYAEAYERIGARNDALQREIDRLGAGLGQVADAVAGIARAARVVHPGHGRESGESARDLDRIRRLAQTAIVATKTLLDGATAAEPPLSLSEATERIFGMKVPPSPAVLSFP